MQPIGKAGNTGPRTRSDCFVQLAVENAGGVQLYIKSRVAHLYGESIRKLCRNILNYHGVKHARLEVFDKGALSWVIAARVEAAIAMAVGIDKYYLSDTEQNRGAALEIKHGFKALLTEANKPARYLNIAWHKPDALIFDCSARKKQNNSYEAPLLVRNAICQYYFNGVPLMVKLSTGKKGIHELQHFYGLNPIEFIVPASTISEHFTEIEKFAQNNYGNTFFKVLLQVKNFNDLHKLKHSRLAKHVAGIVIDSQISKQLKTNDGEEEFSEWQKVPDSFENKPIIQVISFSYNENERFKEALSQDKGMDVLGYICAHPMLLNSDE